MQYPYLRSFSLSGPWILSLLLKSDQPKALGESRKLLVICTSVFEAIFKECDIFFMEYFSVASSERKNFTNGKRYLYFHYSVIKNICSFDDYLHHLFKYIMGWRDGPGVRSTCCSYRGPGFRSQYPHSGFQSSLTPIAGNLTPEFHQYWAFIKCTFSHLRKTLIHLT